MITMRRSMKECQDTGKIERFLACTKIGYLGLCEGNHPYVVPLNFVYADGCVYFHGANAGRKNDMMKKNETVCFTVSEDFGTMAHPVPAEVGTAYFSVMMFGKVKQVEDIDEATKALQYLLDKYVPGYYQAPLSKKHVETYRSSMRSKVVVFKIQVDSLTAKEDLLDENMKFYPGRTITDDVKGRR
ncbi:pyridoxamine 5'-phosphate oxidase family protein [Bacillus songklensis]|uniref:Pyridoxamine 5'-phosphate oxidase family protein n=1 Tax=Bacillus songklensis TaxID=1069116 RepID=A0ABV8B285_9BACI